MLKRPEPLPDWTPLPLQQHPNFACALRHLGRDAQIETFGDQAQALVIRRGPVRFASRGPSWAKSLTEQEKTRVIRDAKLHVVNVECPTDGINYRRAGFLHAVTGASVAELPIFTDPAEQLDQTAGKWRNMFRKAERSPLRISHQKFCPIKHAWLMDADAKQQKSKGFRALPSDITLAFAHIAPHDCLLATAQLRKQTVAAMLFLRHGPVATYHIGWSDSDGRRFAAHQLMLLRAAHTLSQKGVTRIDLGTVDTELTPGLARFKIGTGANVRMLGGSWIKLPLM